jgi:diphthamide biosynthesis protein 7
MTPVHTVHVGGGAWRVKWHPSAQRSNDLLVACMHDGFKVIQMSSEDNISLLDSSAPVEQSVVRFDEHGSLAYGVDWCHRDYRQEGNQQEEDSTMIGSCSFYDHSLKTWFA